MKNFKWGYGIAASLVIGLSGCVMDGSNPQNTDYGTQPAVKADAHAHQVHGKAQAATAKGTSSKGPAQKVTPGPKRAAAPQIPVIQ